MGRAIVTLTSDFGLADSYVAEMKAAILRVCSFARLIDVTHQTPRGDILCGSITLQRAVDGFLPGTIHLAVVDPGVGTDRRILVVHLNHQWVVCPDNGLITWAYRLHSPAQVYSLTWKPRQSSHTFHGRDIMAPVAGMLASGTEIRAIADQIDDPILLDVAPATLKSGKGKVIRVDHFGNAVTNIPYHDKLEVSVKNVRVRGKRVGKIKRTYWDVAPGKPIALIGSAGLLEIAVRDGSAAKDLRVKVGDEVKLD